MNYYDKLRKQVRIDFVPLSEGHSHTTLTTLFTDKDSRVWPYDPGNLTPLAPIFIKDACDADMPDNYWRNKPIVFLNVPVTEAD